MLKFWICVLFSGTIYAASIDKNLTPSNDNSKESKEKRVRSGKHRIVGGNFANKGEYPWLAVLNFRGYFRCGGTILDATTVITAAHCLRNSRARLYDIVAGDYKVWVREQSEQKIRVKRIYKHPQHNVLTKHDSDVAILKLTKRLRFNKFVKPLRLVTDTDMEERLLSNCVAAGVGDVDNFSTPPSRTKEVGVNIQSRSQCFEDMTHYDTIFTDKMICSKDKFKGVCSGDSGGPLICYGNTAKTKSSAYLVGVVSFGHANCFNGFNVYARVSQFHNWINNKV